MPQNRLIIISLFLVLFLPLSAKKRALVPDSLQMLSMEANGVPFQMQRVEGGSFVMGATSEQYDPDTYTDKPAHLVFLSPYYIATTEVTNRLWRAVMNEREMLDLSGYPEHPVSFVSWHEAHEFIRRLDSITGMPFRLPTEAEWEYAARGGEKSKRFRFAGSDEPDSVGWLYSIAGQWTHPVARKQPNEIGLYDMTGNVAEWCQDLYGPYELSTRPDPCGADTGSFRVVRGGSYDNCIGDEPYYISEEVSAALWKKITGFNPPEKEHGIAIGMSPQERVRFAELCSRIADKPLSVATLAEVDSALANGVIAPPKQPKRQRSVRATQRSRKTREKLSPWAELIGVKIKQHDDPILQDFKGDANEKLPLRLVLR